MCFLPLNNDPMFKKSNIVPGGGLPLLKPSALSLRPSHRPGNIPLPWHVTPCRAYATARGFSGQQDLSWPTTARFTPYDIFKQERTAPYSKARFYDLVKIYHPDRPSNAHPLCRDISPEVRLQRYRLIISAHEILSDPAKRTAYDQSGTGWNLHPPPIYRPTPSWASTGSSDYGPIFSNGTWEDWERWYHRHEPKQRHSVDNRIFTTLVVLLVMFGGAIQASWIGQYTSGYEERLREINEESMRFLVGRKENLNQLKSSEAKVQHFLIRRDPSGRGLKEEEGPVYKKVLKREPTSESKVEQVGDRGEQSRSASEPTTTEGPGSSE